MTWNASPTTVYFVDGLIDVKDFQFDKSITNSVKFSVGALDKLWTGTPTLRAETIDLSLTQNKNNSEGELTITPNARVAIGTLKSEAVEIHGGNSTIQKIQTSSFSLRNLCNFNQSVASLDIQRLHTKNAYFEASENNAFDLNIQNLTIREVGVPSLQLKNINKGLHNVTMIAQPDTSNEPEAPYALGFIDIEGTNVIENLTIQGKLHIRQNNNNAHRQYRGSLHIQSLHVLSDSSLRIGGSPNLYTYAGYWDDTTYKVENRAPFAVTIDTLTLDNGSVLATRMPDTTLSTDKNLHIDSLIVDLTSSQEKHKTLIRVQGRLPVNHVTILTDDFDKKFRVTNDPAEDTFYWESGKEGIILAKDSDNFLTDEELRNGGKLQKNVKIRAIVDSSLNIPQNQPQRLLRQLATSIDLGNTQLAEGNAVTLRVAEGEILGSVSALAYWNAATKARSGLTLDQSTITYHSNQKLTSIAQNHAAGLAFLRTTMLDMHSPSLTYPQEHSSNGLWVRTLGGAMEYETQSWDHYGFQMGFTHVLAQSQAQFALGSSIHYQEIDSDFSHGSGDGYAFGWTGFASYETPSGLSMHGSLHWGTLHNDWSLQATSTPYQANWATQYVGVVATMAQRFTLTPQTYVAPQVGFSASHVMSQDYNTSHAMHIRQEGMDSIIGQIGLRTGWQNTRHTKVFASVTYQYDFDGETTSHFALDQQGASTLKEDLGGSWWTLAVGGQYHMTQDLALSAQLQYDTNQATDDTYRWQVGLLARF